MWLFSLASASAVVFQQRLALLVVGVISDQEFVADSCCGMLHRTYGGSRQEAAVVDQRYYLEQQLLNSRIRIWRAKLPVGF